MITCASCGRGDSPSVETRPRKLFCRVPQLLIELSKHDSEERSLLESTSNHSGAKGAKKEQRPMFTLRGG